MTDTYTQLSLNFEMAPVTRPQGQAAPDALSAPHPRYDNLDVTDVGTVVQMSNARVLREHAKRMEEERILMERIRARVAHLQA